MAGTLQFDLVSPERRLASMAATAVQIPATDGDMTAMADHAPTITTLRPGILRVVTDKGTEDFAVTGGFAEITAGATTVLAEQAMPVSEVTADVMDKLVADAQAAVQTAQPDVADMAVKFLADLVAMRGEIRI
jgi:F-type H+-transporting ATPase subunit epsilon